MKIITVANQRGGTGKSTTAAALAQAAKFRGLQCLAVDLDPQGNLSFFLGADTNRAGAFDVLQGKPAADVIQHPGIDTISANWSLQTISSSAGSARRLRAALEPIKKKYSVVIIDTPPTAGELQNNALMAATDLIVPVQADVTGTKSLFQITDTAKTVQRANKNLQLTGYILTRSDRRSTLARQMADLIEHRAREMGIPFLMAIREAVAIREAQALQRSIFEYAPKSKPAQDYLDLFDRIII